MSGGISYVLKRLTERAGRPSFDSTKGMWSFSTKKGAYEGTLWTLPKGLRPKKSDKPRQLKLHHYSKLILSADFAFRMVQDGYPSVSSSGAINQTLSTFKIPCYWSRASRTYGFWCTKGWKGNPSGEEHLEQEKARQAEARKQRAYERLISKPGGLLRVKGYKYKPFAIEQMAKLQEELLSKHKHLEPEPLE